MAQEKSSTQWKRVEYRLAQQRRQRNQTEIEDNKRKDESLIQSARTLITRCHQLKT